MATLFGRRLSLYVGANGSGLELVPDPNSMPKATFEVRQHDLQTPNHARIRVWNLAENTKNQIQQEFSDLVLQAGYQGDQYGQVFVGTIIQVKRGNESAVDSYVDIVAADGDAAYIGATVNSALAAGRTFQDRVNALVAAGRIKGLSQGYVDELPATKLPRGRVYYGMVRDHLRDLAKSTGTSWSIQGGKLQILKPTSYLPGEIVVLNARTGLVGFPQLTEGGVRITCLLNPKIQVGGRVQIDNASLQLADINIVYGGEKANSAAMRSIVAADGVYRVLAVEHVGDTRGDAWNTELTCLAVNQPTFGSLKDRGYS